MAFECNVLGGCKSYNRLTGGAKTEYYLEVEPKHTENGGDINVRVSMIKKQFAGELISN